jgi:hypothetical protein
MHIHATPGPGSDPTESVIGEVDCGLNVITRDPVKRKKTINLPKHDRAEDNPEIDKKGNVDGLKESGTDALKKRSPH